MKITILHVFILMTCLNARSQQYASLNLNTDAGLDYLRMINESKVTTGNMSDHVLIMEEQNASMNVELKWDIISGVDPVDDYTVLLKNTDGTLFYGYQVSGGQIYVHDVTGTFLLGDLSGPVPNINVIRCDDYIYYLIGTVLVLCRHIDDNNFDLNGVVEVTDALDAYVDVVIQTPETCDFICEQIEEQYLALEPFTNWREHAITSPELKIKYVEKYSIAEGINDEVQCIIKDNSGATIFTASPPLTNRYGINLHTVAITPGLLSTGAIYTLCVSGMNKGEEYCLKLRYDGD